MSWLGVYRASGLGLKALYYGKPTRGQGKWHGAPKGGPHRILSAQMKGASKVYTAAWNRLAQDTLALNLNPKPKALGIVAVARFGAPQP